MKNQILELFPVGPEFPDHRRFDPISAVTGAVGIGTSIFGGITGASAAKKAAAAQAQAAQAAGDKVGVAVGEANKPIAEATANAQQLGIAGGQGVLDASGKAAAGVTDAAGKANLLLNPYADVGGKAAGALDAEMGNFGRMPTMQELQMDPGAAWQRQQTELALTRRGAGAGGFFSGEALKDLANYETGALSQDFQNAFNRFRTTTQDRFGNLMGIAGMGQQAAGQQGANLTGAARDAGGFGMQGAQGMLQANEFAGETGLRGAGMIGDNTLRGAMAQGDYLTQAGNAKAAGYVGSANAWNGMAGGISNAVTGAAMMNMLKNPATPGVQGIPAGAVPPGVPGGIPIFNYGKG